MKIGTVDLTAFCAWLRLEEKSAATIEKYRREATRFAAWLDGRDAASGSSWKRCGW